LKRSRRNVAIEPLSFSLYQRPVHPELFNIYRQFDFNLKRFDATLWVTNHCHVLTVSAESVHITELIATPGQPLPGGGLLAKFQLRSQKKHTHVFGNGLRYHCDFSITESTSDELLKKQYCELKRCSGENSTLINFPKLSTAGETAFTFIQTRCSENELNIQTQHSRPGRSELITTETSIDVSQIR
jgi:hypothetical protein